MRYASLFDGICAAGVAWGPLGWECAWTAEIDPYPAAVAHHHHGFVNLGDVNEITEKKIDEHGQLDLVAGGSPCQSFSIAGLGAGLDDPRGQLALRFMQLVGYARPKWVVWENVPGVLSKNEGRDFGTIIGALVKLGYGWSYRVLDAQYYGVPQRRRRVYLVGCLRGMYAAAAVLSERHSLSGHPAPSREAETEIAGTVRGGIESGSNESHDKIAVAALTASGVGTCGADDNQAQAGHLVMAHGQGGAEIVNDGEPSLTCNHEAPICFDTRQDPNSTVGCAEPIGASLPVQGVTIPINTQMATRGDTNNTSREGVGIGNAGDPAYTLQNSHHHAVQTQMSVRRLTPRECERLQGFPDDYTLINYKGKPASDSRRYKALGNSWAIPPARWLGRRIQMVEEVIA